MVVAAAAVRPVLVVNAGSSSLKLRVLDERENVVIARNLPEVTAGTLHEHLGAFLREAGGVEGAGHRVVHGGREFRESVRVTGEVMDRLEQLSDLAPLHNPPAIAALRAALELLPGIPQVACFDTAFHAGLPEEAAVYAIPWEWTEAWGIRRYGFHGLSHSWASRRTAELLRRPVEDLRVVTCHLGAGASLAAVERGRSVDTTMGFTPLEGLVMATRSGSVDPGALLWIQRRAGLSPQELEEVLDHRSGLLGMWGVSGDMRAVLGASENGDPRARLALAAYLHRLRSSIAAMATAMGGVDAIAFTGGVGEGSAAVRAGACAGLEFLGVAIDQERNEEAQDDADLSATHAGARVVFVRAREDVVIAREIRALLRV